MPGIRRSMERYTFAQMKDVPILPTALGYEAAADGRGCNRSISTINREEGTRNA